MDNLQIFEVFQGDMDSKKINEITDQKKSEIYNYLHLDYISYYQSLENKLANMDDFFSWLKTELNINIVYFTKDKKVATIFFFSKTAGSGTIITHDFINADFSYELISLNAEDFVSELIQRDFIKMDPKLILKLSFFSDGHVLYEVGKHLFQWEYQNNFKALIKSPFENIKFNELKIHKDIYDFNNMIQIINNTQFTLELSECLYAYENEKFFLCAAGLGSVLEHLLYLTIEKHVSEKEIKTNENSTAGEYISQLKKNPFNISKREVSHLKNTFAYRNSVSHYNKGIFSKEMCDQLLAGIKISFDSYFMLEPR